MYPTKLFVLKTGILHSFLIVYQLRYYRLFCPRSDLVHAAYPLHRVLCLHLLGYALPLCRLPDHQRQSFRRLPVDLGCIRKKCPVQQHDRVLGVVVFFALAARSVSVYVKENVNFSLLISDDMPEPEIVKLIDDLRTKPFVRNAEYISKSQALEEMKAELNTDPEEFQGYNPFPASVKIKLRADYANNDSIAKIEQQLSTNINIQEVLYQKNLIESMNRHVA